MKLNKEDIKHFQSVYDEIEFRTRRYTEVMNPNMEYQESDVYGISKTLAVYYEDPCQYNKCGLCGHELSESVILEELLYCSREEFESKLHDIQTRHDWMIKHSSGETFQISGFSAWEAKVYMECHYGDKSKEYVRYIIE